MNTLAHKISKNKSQTIANDLSQIQINSSSTFQLVDNRPETIAQRKLQEAINNNSHILVKQNQGSVKPTMQMKGKVNINDNASLEKEVTVMGAKAFQFADNRPETVAQRKLQEIANNSSTSIRSHSQHTLQLMAKEKEGSVKYNKLKVEKDSVENEYNEIKKLRFEGLKEEAKQRLISLRDSELEQYGTEKSYTTFYKNTDCPRGMGIVWRMCEDVRMGNDPLHVYQTSLEIESYTDLVARQKLAGEQNKLYNLKQKSIEITQL